MNSAILLSARNSSTRLPGKALLPLAGAPMTQRLIERLKQARLPGMVMLATSAHEDDDALVRIAQGCGIHIFRGEPDDKLIRYLQAAKAFALDYIVVVDGDDPLCDPNYIDLLLEHVPLMDVDYARVENLPLGVTAHVVQVAALEWVVEHKQGNSEVWPGYFTQGDRFYCYLPPCQPQHAAPWLRLTLDYPEDYELFRHIFDALWQPGEVFGLDDVLEYLSQYPEVAALNQRVVATYAQNIRRKTAIQWREDHESVGGGSGVDGQAAHPVSTGAGR